MLGYLRSRFTLHRFATNPFQMYLVVFLLPQAVEQLIGWGTLELDPRSRTLLAICNIVGANITLAGLLMRDVATGLLVELTGYIALFGGVLIYLGLILFQNGLPNTSFGFAMAEAFVCGSVHRAIQIAGYERNRLRHPVKSELYLAQLDPTRDTAVNELMNFAVSSQRRELNTAYADVEHQRQIISDQRDHINRLEDDVHRLRRKESG